MVDKDAVRRGYDDIAETYAAERSPAGRELEILEQFLDPLPGTARVLDAGCGQGEPILRRLSDAATAVGVDFSGEQLRLASANAPDAALTRGDLASLPIEDGVVDAVVALHSIIHVPLGDHQPVIDEFARILRPGGRVLLSEGPHEWRGTNPDWLESGVEMQWHIAGPEATRAHLERAGFTIANESTATDELGDEDSRWVYYFTTRKEFGDTG